MNSTLKKATARRSYYKTHEEPRNQLAESITPTTLPVVLAACGSLRAERRMAVPTGRSHPADRRTELHTVALRCGSDKIAHASQCGVIGCFETIWFRPDRRQRFRLSYVGARGEHTRQPPKCLIRECYAILHRAHRKPVPKTLHNVLHLRGQDVKIVLSERDSVRLGIGRCWPQDEQKRGSQEQPHADKRHSGYAKSQYCHSLK
jgi:hypothetical protein